MSCGEGVWWRGDGWVVEYGGGQVIGISGFVWGRGDEGEDWNELVI